MDLQYNAAAPGREFSPDQEADIVRLTRERDAALEDNRSLDGVYSDLLRRYEKMRVNSVAMKAVSKQEKPYVNRWVTAACKLSYFP